jgi:hypothetical protein
MFFINVAISALMISFCAWLAEKRPDLAGFIISLPMSTMLVLALSQINSSDDAKTILFAKSISVAIPASLVFFIPFYLADRLKLTFWPTYAMGIACLTAAFFIHRFVFGLVTK